MTHRILITALSDDTPHTRLSYYCAKDIHEKTLYCDAFLPAEANCKYALSAYPVDEIVVFIEGVSSAPEKEDVSTLRQGNPGILSDLEKASNFKILQYRLLQFFEEVSIEDADQNSLLSTEEQQQTIAFLRRFFREHADPEGERKFSRYFHYLIQDAALRADFADALQVWLPEPERDFERYQMWITQYLYRELKASSKLEPLERNENVRIRCIRAAENEVLTFLNGLMPVLSSLECDDGVDDTTELVVCVQNDYASHMLSLMNAMNLTKILPSARIRISRVITESRMRDLPVFEIRDRTEEYSISELLSATGAFLSYGRTDLLVKYWKTANLGNPKIDRIIYAMRNIDSGISLCDIADLERGLRSLREVVRYDLPITGETLIEQYFGLAVESIRGDYGSLLEEDPVPFIDLVRWSYRKGFWQQTLTLIESRAPRDFVDKGIYYYADGERSRKHAIEILGQIYYDLKPFEKYKLDDISHYYIKYYSRRRAPKADGDAYQMGYANVRIEELDTRDENLIRALTICPDRAALKDLLFAYYHLGDVRNQTNHALEEFSGFYTIMAYTDPGERMKLIRQAIDYFIHCYDTVCGLIEGKKANVVKIETADLVEYSKTLRDTSRRSEGSAPRQDRERPAEAGKTPAAETADPVSETLGQKGQPQWREFK